MVYHCQHVFQFKSEDNFKAMYFPGDKKRRDIVVRIRYVPTLDSYLTASQKGSVSMWTSKVRYLKTTTLNWIQQQKFNAIRTIFAQNLMKNLFSVPSVKLYWTECKYPNITHDHHVYFSRSYGISWLSAGVSVGHWVWLFTWTEESHCMHREKHQYMGQQSQGEKPSKYFNDMTKAYTN